MKNAAQFFKVLADEARLKILWLLFNHQELCVCEIMAVLDITQSKASRHLATLRHAGLVTDRKEGLWSHYRLCPVKDELARAHLATLRTTLAGRPDAKQVLRKLAKWNELPDRGVACAGKKTCKASTANNETGPSKASNLAGGNR